MDWFGLDWMYFIFKFSKTASYKVNFVCLVGLECAGGRTQKDTCIGSLTMFHYGIIVTRQLTSWFKD